MRVTVLSFTEQGMKTGETLRKKLVSYGYDVKVCRPPSGFLQIFTKDIFQREDMLVFISACGIAVRAVAPFLEGKDKDPGVVVIDELGRHAISLLSGHLGRANAFTLLAADMLGADPVITTATDINGVFCVDVWAVENHLRIENLSLVKEISSRLLAKEPVGFLSDVPIEGKLPEGLVPVKKGDVSKCWTKQGAVLEAGIFVSYSDFDSFASPSDSFSLEKDSPFLLTCRLIPRDLTVGVGCRRGVKAQALQTALERLFLREKLSPLRIDKFVSIDIKAGEEGIQKLAAHYSASFETYSPEELKEVSGEFSSSAFVKEQVGVDNVCERSACLGSGQGNCIVKKQAAEGITFAVYQRKGKVLF